MGHAGCPSVAADTVHNSLPVINVNSTMAENVLDNLVATRFGLR
jgi:hypothetical protein